MSDYRRIPQITLYADDEDHARSLMKRSGCSQTEVCVQEFLDFGVTKYHGHDAEGLFHQITVRRIA